MSFLFVFKRVALGSQHGIENFAVPRGRDHDKDFYRAMQAATRAVSCILLPLPVGVSVKTTLYQQLMCRIPDYKYSPYVESKDPALQPR